MSSKQLTLKDLKNMIDHVISKHGENVQIVITQEDSFGDTWLLPLYSGDISFNEKQFIIRH